MSRLRMTKRYKQLGRERNQVKGLNIGGEKGGAFGKGGIEDVEMCRENSIMSYCGT